ncbi:MAG: hypothetical protein KatS3mg125_0118 [Lysobacterales bacterium]|jgi:hypothetical protein|nr:MAG: hypothetical protein KatS3mg125_0118 [Xanthomonadales bacterium]
MSLHRSLGGFVFAIVALAFATGCAPSYVVADRPFRVLGADVVSPVDWSVLSRAPIWILSRDGPSLNLILIADGLGKGREVLSGMWRFERQGGATVRSALGLLDLPELFADALGAEGFVGVEVFGPPQPSRWKGRRAVRFELRMADEEGLRYRALAVASLDDRGRLGYLLYLAAEEFFYDRDLPAVESFLAALRD